MAGFSNTIKTTIDVAVNGENGLRSFKQSIGEAEGATGKLKAGFGGASGFIKENAAALAATAGTALVGFAVNAVSSFQNLALEAGKMSDTLGISTESASRWIETAGDVGASTEAVTKSMAKMEKEVAKNPDQFDKLGISIARTSTGAVDANETFLRTLEALKKIKDPTERQEQANKLLGKSWGEIAELVNGDVRAAYESVSDAKVVSAEDVEDARSFRDTLDALQGVVEDLSNKLAKRLLPVINDIGQNIEENKGTWEKAFDGLGLGVQKAAQYFGFAKDPVQEFYASIGDGGEEASVALQATSDGFLALATAAQEAGVEVGDEGDAADEAAKENALLAQKTKEAADAAAEAKRKYESLLGVLDQRQAYTDVQQSLAELKLLALDAFTAASTGAEDASTKAAEYQAALIPTVSKVLEYAQSVDAIPDASMTTITALINEGDYQSVLDRLEILTRNRTVSIGIEQRGGAGYGPLTGARAGGGPVRAGGSYLVGEKGPEVVTMGGNGFVTPNGGMGGVTINLTVQAGMLGQDVPRMAVEALAQAVRSMGAGTVQKALGL